MHAAFKGEPAGVRSVAFVSGGDTGVGCVYVGTRTGDIVAAPAFLGLVPGPTLARGLDRDPTVTHGHCDGEVCAGVAACAFGKVQAP